MVSEDNFSDGVFKTRPVLSDVTNRPAKRPFASISADSIHKSGVEHSVKRKAILQFGPTTPQIENGKMPFQSQENQNHPSPTLPFSGAVPDTPSQNTSTQKSDSTPSVSEEQNLLAESSLGFGDDAQQVKFTCGVSEPRTLTEVLSNRAVQSDNREEHCIIEKLASSKRGAMEPPIISASRDFGLERCSALKNVSCANPVVSSGDLLKNCTCSFCSKAAYIWTDLHYQDVKGRLGALKKSRKEASTKLQKFTVLKDKLIHDPQSTDDSSKIELSLMEQWKSLFVHMENTFAQEGKQLESSLGALRDLRGSCKNDLDLSENSQSDNH